MAKLNKKTKHIVDVYVKYFGRVATEDEIRSFDDVKTLSKITAEVRVNAANESGLKGSDYLNSIIQNLFGRSEANAFESKYAKKLDDNVYYNLPIATIIKKGSKDDKGVYNAKKLVAEMLATKGGSYELANINQDNYLSIYNAKKGLLVSTVDDLEARISNVPDIINGKTDMLTTGVDTLKGTAKNDLFLATAKANWSVADSIDGGKGVDTLKIIDTAAIAQTDLEPISATIKNVEILDLISGAAVTADTTSIDGVTDLYTTSKGTNTSTAAATTNINATASALSGVAGAVDINGGKNVTVTASDTSTTAVASGNTILVGDTTAAKGTVAVTYTDTVSDATVAAGGAITGSSITVTGGTTVKVDSKAVVGVADNAGDIFTIGTVTVNGNASTTAVTVNQTAATEAFGTPAANTKIKIINGAVNITDKNTDVTAADTIATVSLENFGLATITSSALSTLNLKGGASATTASGNLDLDKSATDTTVLPTTLNVNSTGGFIGELGLSAGTSTMAATYTAVNVTSTAATTFANATFAANKTLTVDGAGVTTFTAFTGNTALESIVSKGAGVTIGTALANDVTFTGGAGVENIKIGATTKTIDLGAGDDTATISTTVFGAGGSLNGGAGNDTLVVTTVANSNIAGLPHIVGFETLKLDGVATGGKHNAHTFKALEIGTGAVATEFENVAAGVGLTVLAANTANTTTVTLANSTGTADVFDLTLKSDGDLDAGTVVLAGVETININSVDTDIDTSIPTTVNDNDLILTATAAKSIVVTGNTNLDLVNTSATLVTSFDASAATGKINYKSANATIGEIVTIKGGAGDDILEGNSAITVNDIIFGGAGNDIITYSGGKDTFTGGAGNDTFKFAAGALGTKDVHLTIADLSKGDKIDLTGIATITAAGKLDTAKVTLGAAATLDNYLDAAAAGGGTATAAVLKWFQFENNTYLVVDNNAGNTFDTTATTGDSVIKITGLVDLTNSTYATDEIITIA